LHPDRTAIHEGFVENKSSVGTWPCQWLGKHLPRILFIQATEAAALPPVINAAVLLAERGWKVAVLTAPIAGRNLSFPEHPDIQIHALPGRQSHVMSKPQYARYISYAIRLALSIRPSVIYISDQLGTVPGFLAAKLTGARLVYHEHDSLAPTGRSSVLRYLRRVTARSVDLVVFPNAERARIAQAEIGFAPDRLQVVWNMPRKTEIPVPVENSDRPMIVYYHGSISPERLPESVAHAICRFQGAVRLRIAGYEAPGSEHYIARLKQWGTVANGCQAIEYLGLFPSRSQLLAKAAQAHVGLSLLPQATNDINMQHMAGASNKIFDYMAAGLATLVSDSPDWTSQFVKPGFARACDPASVDSVAAALSWFRDNPALRRQMGARSRSKIRTDWNYDMAFKPVINRLNAWTRT
jgi:glycosyltransferase involved in cell wall biosynthesis